MYQFDSEKDVAERDLKKCVGQVLYLKNLAKVTLQLIQNLVLMPRGVDAEVHVHYGKAVRVRVCAVSAQLFECEHN